MKRFISRTLFTLSLLALSVFFQRTADAASLSFLTNKTGLEVGETFEVSILLNTDGKEVNAVEIGLEFPADKLQVISPNTGRSVIEIWAGQPKFNNKAGLLEMRGGIPNGLVINNGLIATVQFRVKASGSASLQFTSATKILANDGLGTDLLVRTPGVFLTAQLPKPAGPVVTSPTHSEQGRWYPNPDVVFDWVGEEGAEAYSYILNDEAIFEPDTIAEEATNSISYNKLASGIHYFHIRSLRAGLWGGSTHFQVSIDYAPPADFKIEAIPSLRTSSRQPVLKFFTTDGQSGLDHFEIKMISLAPTHNGEPADDELFSDAQSPYVTYPLEVGSYDVIVRAYDKARNYRESKERLVVTTAIFSIIQDNGLQLSESFILTWPWIWLISMLMILFFIFTTWRLKHWPRKLGMRHEGEGMPDVVRKQLEELRVYQKRYGKIAAVVLFALAFTFGGRSVDAAPAGFVASAVQTPPIITTVSGDITTADTFYIGGETVTPNTDVVVYWNNLTTGETLSAVTTSNDASEWFYHYPESLRIGNYLLWAQSRIGETVSPPSPQFTMIVRSDALKIGPARISYELAYLLIIAVLLMVLLALGLLTIRKWHVIRMKHKRFMEELRSSEESIRRGFAVLRRDLELEFAAIKATGNSRALTRDEKAREKQIVTDIEVIQNKIGKEIWELEKIEN